MQNKDIYQSLYDQQERFRNNFPTLSDFETYVSREGKLDEVKDIYQFDENSIVDPLKKKRKWGIEIRFSISILSEKGKG